MRCSAAVYELVCAAMDRMLIPAAGCFLLPATATAMDRLVDWLVEVHLKFKLRIETLYLTVNVIDQYLQIQQVNRSKLQLVGVTALLIASKYEEIYPPEVRDLVYITDRTYTRNQILTMESVMLNALKFRITVPTCMVFLERFLKAARADKKRRPSPATFRSACCRSTRCCASTRAPSPRASCTWP